MTATTPDERLLDRIEDAIALAFEGEGEAWSDKLSGDRLARVARRAVEPILERPATTPDEREALRGALANVLSNASNYPKVVSARILGQDMGPLIDKVADAVESAGYRRSPIAPLGERVGDPADLLDGFPAPAVETDDPAEDERVARFLALVTPLGYNSAFAAIEAMTRLMEAETQARLAAAPAVEWVTDQRIDAATHALCDYDTDIADRGLSEEHWRERRADVVRVVTALGLYRPERGDDRGPEPAGAGS